MNKINFKPCPGYILIDSLQSVKKSDLVVVSDKIDDPHQGIVVAVGDTRITDYGVEQKPHVKVGDHVLYSIAGIEKTRLPYGKDLRHQFVIAPFGRVLGII